MKWLQSPLLIGAAAIIGLSIFIVFTVRKTHEPVRVFWNWIISIFLLATLFVPLALQDGVQSREGAYVVAIYSAILGIILCILWGPFIGSAVANVVAAHIQGGDEPPEPKPQYSAALAKRKTGHYQEALELIRKQLEIFPEDFEGEMLEAAIHAENLNDLARAKIAIERLVSRKGTPPAQITGALNTLADWHLKHDLDPWAAKAALESILKAVPDTEFATLASQRIAHLASQEHLVETHERRTLKIVPTSKRLGLEMPQPTNPEDELARLKSETHSQIQQCLDQLKQFPEDAATREQLALLYAEECNQPMLAALELEQLILTPNASHTLLARWHHLLADVQSRKLGDIDAARSTLEKLKNRFPDSGIAEAAMNRINLIALESKGKKEPSRVEIGEYEKNLGLKWARIEKNDNSGRS